MARSSSEFSERRGGKSGGDCDLGDLNGGKRGRSRKREGDGSDMARWVNWIAATLFPGIETS